MARERIPAPSIICSLYKTVVDLFGFIQTADFGIPCVIIILIRVLSTLLICHHNENYLDLLSRSHKIKSTALTAL